MKINVSFLILWICQSVQASAMDNDSISVMSHLLDYYSKVPQERIYLHTDRPYYMVGDTICFVLICWMPPLASLCHARAMSMWNSMTNAQTRWFSA